MSTTYKPALLKAITRILARERQTVIALTAIGAEFARLYWNQAVVVHLRQAAVLSKEPEVLKSIRVASQRYHARALRDLPDEAYGAILRDLARILKINVLRAFHTSKPAGALPLFTWEEGADEIVLPEAALDFIVTNSQALEVIANYWWAGCLEKVNMLAPSIIEKVGRDGARRSSLVKYFRILTAAGRSRSGVREPPTAGSKDRGMTGKRITDHQVLTLKTVPHPLGQLVLVPPLLVVP
jgi:hypothetical protein